MVINKKIKLLPNLRKVYLMESLPFIVLIISNLVIGLNDSYIVFNFSINFN